jgi:hypothetical protein
VTYQPNFYNGFGSGAGIRTLNLAVNRPLQPVQRTRRRSSRLRAQVIAPFQVWPWQRVSPFWGFQRAALVEEVKQSHGRHDHQDKDGSDD